MDVPEGVGVVETEGVAEVVMAGDAVREVVAEVVAVTVDVTVLSGVLVMDGLNPEDREAELVCEGEGVTDDDDVPVGVPDGDAVVVPVPVEDGVPVFV